MNDSKVTPIHGALGYNAKKRPANGGGTGGGTMTESYVTHTEFQEAVSGINDRFARIDERFARIETRLDQTATKADLEGMKSDMTRWMVGTAIGVSMAFITIITFVLNNAIPKPPHESAIQPPPIVINIPPSVQAYTQDQAARADLGVKSPAIAKQKP